MIYHKLCVLIIYSALNITLNKTVHLTLMVFTFLKNNNKKTTTLKQHQRQEGRIPPPDSEVQGQTGSSWWERAQNMQLCTAHLRVSASADQAVKSKTFWVLTTSPSFCFIFTKRRLNSKPSPWRMSKRHTEVNVQSSAGVLIIILSWWMNECNPD